MSFKDRVNRDIGKVFLDTRFFSENRTIRYEGEEYADIPVSLQETGEEERQLKADDHAQGFYLVRAVLFWPKVIWRASRLSKAHGWKSTAWTPQISLSGTR